MMTNLPSKPPTVEQIIRKRKVLLSILAVTGIIIASSCLALDLQIYFKLIYSLMVCFLFVVALKYTCKTINMLPVLNWLLGVVVIFSGLFSWLKQPEVHTPILDIMFFIIMCDLALFIFILGMCTTGLQTLRTLDEKRVQQIYQATQKSNVIHEYVELINAMPKRKMIVLDYGVVFSYLDENGIDYSDIVPDE